jgi:hypothetical protein
MGEDTFLRRLEMADSRKILAVVDLIKNRPDLNYMQIALCTGSTLTAVAKAARDHKCQRVRGRKKTVIEVTPSQTLAR